MSERPLRTYFGHHKCGTSWIVEILVDVAKLLDLKPAYLHNTESFGGDLPAFLREQNIDLLLYVNADIDHVRQLPDVRGFHVIRDPRDLIVSAYFSHRYSHPLQPWLETHRERLQKLDDAEGLLEEMRFEITRGVLDQMRRWDYAQPHVLELRLEDLSRAPERYLSELFAFLELPLDPGQVSALAQRHDFRTKAGGRAPGEEDVRSHYRKGTAGDWARHFSDVHRAHFKREFQDILEKLDYERSATW